MEYIPEEAIKLTLAVIVGGLIGAEREFRDKSAGFRTIIFIAVGATLFTIFSLGLGMDSSPTRIAANIVTGIGFLGAGAIMREGGKVAGLTTAATIWLAAALGMGLGAGKYTLVGLSTLTILLVLWLFPRIEHLIDNIRETRIYEIILPLTSAKREELNTIFSTCRIKVIKHSEMKTGDRSITIWSTVGRPQSHLALTNMLMEDQEVIEFRS
ncbi:MAG: MgtC/SapB family protein [Chloroflexota bacterium]